MQLGSLAHAFGSENSGDLYHGLDIVGAVEEGEPSRQDGEENYSGGPDVDFCSLFCALEQHLGGAKSPGAGTVGATRGTSVVLGVAGLRTAVGQVFLAQSLAADVAQFMTQAGFGVGAFPLGEAEINEHAALGDGVVEEVRRFDVAVDDMVFVDEGEGGEEGAQVNGHVDDVHLAEVVAEVVVGKVREDGDDLIGAPEGGDEGADGGAVPQIVQEFQLVEDAGGGRGDVDLLDGDVFCRAAWLGILGVV